MIKHYLNCYNYTTTITSNNGQTNVNTNDLTLTEVSKDNMNTDNVKGQIIENHLTEKDDSYSENWNLAFTLPVNIVRKDFQSKDGTIPSEDPNKTPVKAGDWKGALANTTYTYKNSDGYDFSVSPNSIRGTMTVSKKIGQANTWLVEQGSDIIRNIAGYVEVNDVNKASQMTKDELKKFYEKRKNEGKGAGIIDGVEAVFKAILGTPAITAAFVEDTDIVVKRGKQLIDADEQKQALESAPTSFINGMLNSKADVLRRSIEFGDTADQYNPSYGLIADLGETVFGMALGWNGKTAGLIAINSMVARNETIRANSEHLGDGYKTTYHSQATVIGKGVNNILASQGTQYKDGYGVYAIGPAVTEESWKKNAGQTQTNDKFVDWEADKTDPVQDFANPLNPIKIIRGVGGVMEIMSPWSPRTNTHSTTNPLYNQYLKKDTDHDYSDRPY